MSPLGVAARDRAVTADAGAGARAGTAEGEPNRNDRSSQGLRRPSSEVRHEPPLSHEVRVKNVLVIFYSLEQERITVSEPFG